MSLGESWMRGMSGSVRDCFFHKFAFGRFVDKITLFVDKPKSVIRHAGSVSDGGNEAFGHLARFCPHPASLRLDVARYAFS